jgi:hypothetical protein
MLLSVNHDVSRVDSTGVRTCQVVARESVTRVRAAHVVARVLGATGVRTVHVVAWVGATRAIVAQVVARVAVTVTRPMTSHVVARVAATVPATAHDVPRVEPTVVVGSVLTATPRTRTTVDTPVAPTAADMVAVTVGAPVAVPAVTVVSAVNPPTSLLRVVLGSPISVAVPKVAPGAVMPSPVTVSDPSAVAPPKRTMSPAARPGLVSQVTDQAVDSTVRTPDAIATSYVDPATSALMT